MKKTNFSKFLILLLVVCLTCSMILLTACDNNGNDNLEPNKTVKDTQLVKNGDFTFTSGDAYPRTATNWSGSLNGSGSYQPEGGLDVVKHGVINVGKDYDASKKNWDNLKNPGTHEGAKPEDKNMLMIYGSKPTSFSYVCDSFELKANKYYKLSFWVNTVNISGKDDNVGEGAYINVSGGNVRAEWIDINTNDQWQKFEVFVEGGLNASSTLRVTFGLGNGDRVDKHLTKGYAFFDDVLLEEVEKSAYDNAKVNKVPNPSVKGDTYEHKDSFRFSNANFTNYSKLYSSLPYAPTAWTFGYGGENDDAANNVEDKQNDRKPATKKGLIDFTKVNKDNKTTFGLPEDFDVNTLKGRNGSADDFALMLFADKDYSIKYQSSSYITIEKGQIYRIGVWVKTFDTVKDETAKGTIILSNDNEDYRISFDNAKYYTKEKPEGVDLVKNADGWAEIVFNVRGNNTHDVKYNLSLTLGTDGISKKDTNWSCGHVLYDDISIKSFPITKSDKNSTSINSWAKESKNATSVDLNKFNDDATIKNDVKNGNFINTKVVDAYTIPDNFEVVKKENYDVKFDGSINVKNNVQLPFEVIYKFGDTADVATNALVINSDKNTTIGLKHTSTFTATMNKQYRLAFWIKTENMPKSAGMNFNLNILDENGKVAKTELLTDVNSANINKDNDRYNGWQEVVFYINGDSYEDKNFTIDMTFGRGNTFDETLARGTAYIYNINMQTIDLTAYSNATSNSTNKKVDLATNTASETPANGSFNKITTSSSTFDEKTGKLTKLGTAQNWSIDNDKVPSEVYEKTEGEGEDKKTVKKETAKKGVADLTSTDNTFVNSQFKKILEGEGLKPEQISALNITEEIYKKIANNGENKFALAIYASEPIIYNYKSSFIDLSADSFYSLRVKVFTAGNASATLKLISSSPHEEGIDTFVVQSDGINKDVEATTGWSEYTFYIKTGMTSASVNLVLSLGDLDSYKDNKTGLSSGLVMFDDAKLTKHQSKESYEHFLNKAEANKHTELVFNTDGFATSSYDKDKVNSPNGWTTTPIESAPDILGDKATIAGVIDLTRNDPEKIWEYTDKGVDKKDDQAYKDYIDKKVNLLNDVKNPTNGYKAEFGNSVLMIDNMIASGYKVSTSSSKTLKKDAYYKISLWIYADIEKNENNLGLTLSLKISDRNQDVVRIENIQTTNGWKEFSFYVKNVNDIKATDLNANLTMQLGTREKIDDKDVLKAVKGTVFVDNFKVEKIEENAEGKSPADQYTAIEQSIKNGTNKNAAVIAYVPDKDANQDADKEDEKEKAPVDWKMLAWAIPTIILAVMLIAVLGVFIYKKYAGPKKHTKFKGDKKKPKKEEVKKPDDFDKFND